MFFSRQIGLADDFVVPINVGGRVTGRAGAYTLGLLAIQTEELPAVAVPSTNFGVVRLKRDVFRRSNIGMIGTYRSHAVESDGSNKLIGFDGNFAFYENVDINAYYARTDSPDRTGRDTSYLGRFVYGGDRYGVELERLAVGENFNPEVGFTRREDFERSSASCVSALAHSGSTRFASLASKAAWTTLPTAPAWSRPGRPSSNSRRSSRAATTFLRRTDATTNSWTRSSTSPMTSSFPSAGIPYDRIAGTYRFGPQRRVSGRVRVETGGFFSGDLTEFQVQGRANHTPVLDRATVAINWATYRKEASRRSSFAPGSTTCSRHACLLGPSFNTIRKPT